MSYLVLTRPSRQVSAAAKLGPTADSPACSPALLGFLLMLIAEAVIRTASQTAKATVATPGDDVSWPASCMSFRHDVSPSLTGPGLCAASTSEAGNQPMPIEPTNCVAGTVPCSCAAAAW